MKEQKTKVEVKKLQQLPDNTHSLSPHSHFDINQPCPAYPIPTPFVITI